ncbi:transglutaminase domain-containing protein [candidate division WOR-3 bacterium]|nr:transglutaminase domain-containing protein [candidate division WOR-3 bacterium]
MFFFLLQFEEPPADRIISATVVFEKINRAETYDVEMIFTAGSPKEAGRLAYVAYDQSRSALIHFDVSGVSSETNEEIRPLRTERISYSAGASLSYSGYVEEYAVFPDFYGQAVFKLNYSLLTDSTIWGEDFIFSIPVGDELPLDTLDIKVISEKQFTWTSGGENGSIAPGISGPETLFVRFTSLEPIDPDFYPENTVFFIASSFFSFRQIADNCLNLFCGKLLADAEVRETAQSISRGYPKEAKARRIFDFVSSSIDYTALEWGWRGFYPNEPSVTLSEGKGDCKDKVSLLIAMLGCAGVKAWPALIATRGTPDLSFSPPAVFFNHVIALVEINGEAIFCDPSNPGVPFGALPFEDRGVTALVLFDDSFALMKTPDSFTDEYTRIVSGSVSSEGAAELTVSDTVTGVISSFYRREILSRGTSSAYNWFALKLPGWKILGAWAYSNSPVSAAIGARVFRKALSAGINYFNLPLLYIVPPATDGYYTNGPVRYFVAMRVAVPENIQAILPSDYFYEDRLLKVEFKYERTADSIFVFHLFSIKNGVADSDELENYEERLFELNLLSKRPLLLIKSDL